MPGMIWRRSSRYLILDFETRESVSHWVNTQLLHQQRHNIILSSWTSWSCIYIYTHIQQMYHFHTELWHLINLLPEKTQHCVDCTAIQGVYCSFVHSGMNEVDSHIPSTPSLPSWLPLLWKRCCPSISHGPHWCLWAVAGSAAEWRGLVTTETMWERGNHSHQKEWNWGVRRSLLPRRQRPTGKWTYRVWGELRI